MKIFVKIKLHGRTASVKKITNTEYEVRLTKPPVDGAANEELRNVLAEHFACKKWQVSILAGHASTSKIIEIEI